MEVSKRSAVSSLRRWSDFRPRKNLGAGDWLDLGISKWNKKYIRVTYEGIHLYAHRIIWAKFRGYLNPRKTINHKDLNGLNNQLENLELITPSQNTKHACEAYRRMGMTALEAKASWARQQRVSSWGGINATTNSNG
jgi:hypothetical protein